MYMFVHLCLRRVCYKTLSVQSYMRIAKRGLQRPCSSTPVERVEENEENYRNKQRSQISKRKKKFQTYIHIRRRDAETQQETK